MEDRQRYQQGGPLSTPRSARRGPAPGQLTAAAAASPRSSLQAAYKTSSRGLASIDAANKGTFAGAVTVASDNRSSSGGRPGHSPQQQGSTYTAALLKRQAASALHKPAQAAGTAPAAAAGSKEAGNPGRTAPARATHVQLSARQQQQQQQHSQAPADLSALAAKLQASIGSYCSSRTADKNSPRGASQQHQQQQNQQQQQQQQSLHVCYGSRSTSSGSGGYAIQGSSRGALLSARGVTSVNHMPVADGWPPAAAAVAQQQQQQQQQQLPSAAAGAASYSQQLTSALSMLSAVTAANTAAAAMLRAVASEAAKTTAGSTAAALGNSSSSSSSSSSGLQGQPVLPPLRLASHHHHQQQQVYQPVTARIRQVAAQAVMRTDRPAVAVPAALVDAGPAQAEPNQITAAAAAAATAAPTAAGIPSSLSILAATGSSCRQECTTTDLEAPNSPAGGIGYTKLRRLQTQSGAGSTAAATADTPGGGGEPHSPLPAVVAAGAGTGSTRSSADTNIRSSAAGMLAQQQQQQQQQAQVNLWTSEDVVMGWYHHSDDEEEDSCQQHTSCAAAAAATGSGCFAQAAAAGPTQLSSPDSLRPFLQQAFSSSSAGGMPAGDGGMPLLTAPAGLCRLLTTSSGGIEYAKLLRTQAVCVSPASSPRHSRFQQQQQQQQHKQSADEGHSGSSARVCSKLVTGWYSSGLHSDSSCGNSPDASYAAADPQAPSHAMCADAVPHACGTTHCLVSSTGSGGGGTVPVAAAAAATAVPAVRASSSGGWSTEGGSGWGLPPYQTYPALPGGPSAAAPGSLALAVGATLGVGAPAILWHDGSQQQGSSAGVSVGGASSAFGHSGGGVGPVAVGTFDLRPCFAGAGAPLLTSCTRDASVTELLEASQAQIHNMESTLASMLQVAKRWTEGGMCEPVGVGESLRDRFSST